MLDTYGFLTDCGPCIDHGLANMDNPPDSEAGLAEAKASFGEGWDKYRASYMWYVGLMTYEEYLAAEGYV